MIKEKILPKKAEISEFLHQDVCFNVTGIVVRYIRLLLQRLLTKHANNLKKIRMLLTVQRITAFCFTNLYFHRFRSRRPSNFSKYSVAEM